MGALVTIRHHSITTLDKEDTNTMTIITDDVEISTDAWHDPEVYFDRGTFGDDLGDFDDLYREGDEAWDVIR